MKKIKKQKMINGQISQSKAHNLVFGSKVLAINKTIKVNACKIWVYAKILMKQFLRSLKKISPIVIRSSLYHSARDRCYIRIKHLLNLKAIKVAINLKKHLKVAFLP